MYGIWKSVRFKLLRVAFIFVWSLCLGFRMPSSSAVAEGSPLDTEVPQKTRFWGDHGSGGVSASISTDRVRPEAKAFHRDLLERRKHLRDMLEEAREELSKKHRREHTEMAKRDDAIIEKVEEEIWTIRCAMAEFNNPRVVFIEVYYSFLPEHIFEPFGSHKPTTVKDYPRWSSVTPRRTVAVINRQNIGTVLRQAEHWFRTVAYLKQVPPEVMMQHKHESEEYKAFRDNFWTRSDQLVGKAMRAVHAPKSASSVTFGEYLVQMDKLTESAKEALKVLRKTYVSFRCVDPVGSYVYTDPDRSRPMNSTNKVFLVIKVKVRCDYFVPSPDEYRSLCTAYPGLSARPGNRRNVLVFDSNKFSLILSDGRSLRPGEFVNPSAWGGDVIVVPSGRSTRNLRRRREPICIVGRKDVGDSAMNILICWEIRKEWEGPFKLRYGRLKPVPVPEKPFVIDEMKRGLRFKAGDPLRRKGKW